MTRPHELPGGPILTGDPTAGAAAIAKRVGRDGSSITGARCGNRGAGCGDGAGVRRRAYETGNGGMSAPAGGETPATYRHSPMRAEIIERWNRGDSAGVIAREMRTSRNCVIGHVHRARLAGCDVRDGQPERSEQRRRRADGFRPAELALIEVIDAAEGAAVTYAEIAEALGVTVWTVKTRMSVIRRGRPEMMRSIRTVYGVGYRFVGAPLSEIAGGDAGSEAREGVSSLSTAAGASVPAAFSGAAS